MAACEGCPVKAVQEIAEALGNDLADKILDDGFLSDSKVNPDGYELQRRALETAWEKEICKQPEKIVDPRDGEVMIQCTAQLVAVRVVNHLLLERRVARMATDGTPNSDNLTAPQGSTGMQAVIDLARVTGSNGEERKNGSHNGAYL